MTLEELKEWLDDNYTEQNKHKTIYMEQWSEDDSPMKGISEFGGFVTFDLSF